MQRTEKIKKPIEKGIAKTPFIMQMEALECGAACLSMVLAYYDKWIPLEQARKDCGVSRDGSNAKNILKAARRYGLEAFGYRMEPEELKEAGFFPCIVFWRFNHFIVVNGFHGKQVSVNDPARGRYDISINEFDEGFTGVCILLEPGEGFTPSGHKKQMLPFAMKRLKETGGALPVLATLTALAGLVALISAGIYRAFLDQMLTGLNPEWYVPFLVFSLIAAGLEFAIAAAEALLTYRTDGNLAALGETSFFWKLLRLPMDFFSQRMAGDIQLRQASNAQIAAELTHTFAPLFVNAFMMIFYLAVMLSYNPLLALAGVTAVLLNLMLSVIIAGRRVNIARVYMREEGKLSASTVSGIEMIETIKATGAEQGFFQRWAGFQSGAVTEQSRFQELEHHMNWIPEAVLTVTTTCIMGGGIYLVLQGAMTSGMVMIFLGFLQSFLNPASMLVSAGQALQELRTEMERVEDVLEYEEDPVFDTPADDPEGPLKKLDGQISVKHVSYGYSPLAEPILKDFSVEIPRGGRIALVGASGCGKSTIGKLIAGLVQPWEGEITYGGKKLKEINRDVFTGSLAVVDQEITLFEDTVENNIKMWDRSIEDYEMILAARDARLHETILQREGGYKNRILENGRDFSGGERQRMEIARVLAADPTIVILDEATSALDAATEADVIRAITDRGVTCIIIAHRLSTIRDCDEIIVLQRGETLDRGKHEELMERCETYRALVLSE